MTSVPPLVTLTFRPTFELVSAARRFVSSLYDAILTDPDASSRIGLTTHELLENAMKYSTDGTATLEIEIRRSGDQDLVSLRISNTADSEHLRRLEHLFEGMHETTDAFTYFTSLMVENANQAGSGLGLARIWAEADMTMSCEIVGTVATIVAETAVELRQAS
jgi:hypothetical protein